MQLLTNQTEMLLRNATIVTNIILQKNQHRNNRIITLERYINIFPFVKMPDKLEPRPTCVPTTRTRYDEYNCINVQVTERGE